MYIRVDCDISILPRLLLGQLTVSIFLGRRTKQSRRGCGPCEPPPAPPGWLYLLKEVGHEAASRCAQLCRESIETHVAVKKTKKVLAFFAVFVLFVFYECFLSILRMRRILIMNNNTRCEDRRRLKGIASNPNLCKCGRHRRQRREIIIRNIETL